MRLGEGRTQWLSHEAEVYLLHPTSSCGQRQFRFPKKTFASSVFDALVHTPTVAGLWDVAMCRVKFNGRASDVYARTGEMAQKIELGVQLKRLEKQQQNTHKGKWKERNEKQQCVFH